MAKRPRTANGAKLRRTKKAKRKLDQLLTPSRHIESADAAHDPGRVPHIEIPVTKSAVAKKSKPTKRASAKSRKSAKHWSKLPLESMMDIPMCELGLSIEGTPLEKMQQKLYSELQSRGLKLRPHCWLSDEWFAPDGIPGIAIPFYLAHPRLIRLERQQMLDVEGGTREWCMRILRHETGHAFDTAFALHRKKRYRDVFGSYSKPYPDYYRPKPRSKNFVQHLEPWYAQSHPAEDFAETFAVWLKPGNRWKKDYAGWKAMKKLELVDQLMAEIIGQPVKVRSRRKIDPVDKLKKTLREHYYQRHQRYDINYTTSFDEDLVRLFQSPETKCSRKAATFLMKHRNEFCRTIAQWTGEYRYNINQVIREMIERCRGLDLRIDKPSERLKRDTMIMMTVHTMNYLYRGNHQVAL